MRLLLALLLLTVAHAGSASAWGLASHRFVNETAIELLPEPLRSHFRANRELLSDLAVAPDVILRPRDGEREGRRHYIHLDAYGGRVEELAELSRRAAEQRFGRKRVQARGTLPWVILDHARGIERAMRSGDWAKALRTAGFAGHYLSDGFMPLHTTENHDGQKSSAGRGLHAALEHDVLDPSLRRRKKAVRALARPAQREPFSQSRVLALLRRVQRDVSPLVDAHVDAAGRGAVGSTTYLEALAPRVTPLLERRLADAVSAVASLWLSCWVEAGEPTPPLD